MFLHMCTNYTHTHTQYRFNDPCSHLSATCWLNGLIKIQLLDHQLLQAARILWSHAHRHHQLSASPTLSFRPPLTAFISLEGLNCHQMRHTHRCLCTATLWLTRSSHPLVMAAITQLHICCSLAPAQEHSEIHTVFKICTRKAPTQDSSLTDVDETTPVTSGNNVFPLLCRKTSQNMACLLHHRLTTNLLSPGRCSVILSNGQQGATRLAAKCSWSYRKSPTETQELKTSKRCNPDQSVPLTSAGCQFGKDSAHRSLRISCRRLSENPTRLLLMFQQWILQCLNLTPPTVCSAGMLLHVSKTSYSCGLTEIEKIFILCHFFYFYWRKLCCFISVWCIWVNITAMCWANYAKFS